MATAIRDCSRDDDRSHSGLERQELEGIRIALAHGRSLEENAACIVVGSELRRQPMRLWIRVCPDFLRPVITVVVVGRTGNNPRVDCSYLGCVIHTRLDDVGNDFVCRRVDLGGVILGRQMLVSRTGRSKLDVKNLVAS